MSLKVCVEVKVSGLKVCDLGIGIIVNPYLTRKSSESSTVGPREPWLDLGSRPGRFGEL